MIKNYTSEMPTVVSINHIEKVLVEHGATNIMKIYDNQILSGLAFSIKTGDRETPFKLPARIDRIELKLRAARKRRHTSDSIKRSKEQAQRTAWKILSDWIDIQMTMLSLDQTEMVELFMPYIYDHSKKQTFFESFKQTGFLIEDRTQHESRERSVSSSPF